MATAKRTDPKLWEKVKAELLKSDKGGDKGEWSARKAQLAVQEYKRRGGGYEGSRSSDNDLSQWNDEEWGTESGGRSRDTGERYLPKKARKALSGEEYERTSAKKRADGRKGEQYSSQPADVARKTAKYRKGGSDGAQEGGPRRADLMDVARALGVEGRSKMDRDALQEAVVEAVKENDDVTRDELMSLARAFEVSGRSSMSKADLKRAIAGAAH